jgi:hypothetical protein
MTVKLQWTYSTPGTPLPAPANFRIWYGYTYASPAPIAAYLDKFVTVPGTQTNGSIDFSTSNQRAFSVTAVNSAGVESEHSNQVIYPP